MATTFPIKRRRYSGTWGKHVALWRADRYGNRLERLEPSATITGTITANEDAEIRKRLSLDVTRPRDLEPFRDFLIPEVSLITPAGIVTTEPQGLFMVAPPNALTNRARQMGTLEGLDLTYLAARSSVGAYTFPVGTDTGAAAREVLMGAGYLEQQVNVPNTGVLLTAEKTPAAGDSRLKVATDLLNAGNWYAPWMDRTGRITTMPYQNLPAGVPRITYASGEQSLILSGITETPDWSRLRNAVTVRNIVPGGDAIVWTERITNQAHPLYYDPLNTDIGLGIELAGDPVDDPDLPDLAAAQARARSLLAEGSSYYRKTNLRTVVDLQADLHDLIGLDVRHGEESAYSGTWWSRTYTIRLGRLTATMDRELYRVEAWQ